MEADCRNYEVCVVLVLGFTFCCVFIPNISLRNAVSTPTDRKLDLVCGGESVERFPQ